jgi:uncharacterized protein YjlB
LDAEDKDDLVVELGEGDAIVLPAGVAHCSVESSGDYEYVGLYPEVCSAVVEVGEVLMKKRGVLIGIIISVRLAVKRPGIRRRMQGLCQFQNRILCLGLGDR